MFGNGKTPNNKKPSRGKKIILTICIVLAVIIAAVAAGVLYIGNIDTIYPGVTLNGADLSGMTTQEASAAIGNMDISATITLPNGDIFTVTAKDAGVPITAEEITEAAASHGRNGNIFENVISYLTASSNPFEIVTYLKSTIDPEAVKTVVTPYVDAYNTDVGGALYEITGEKLIIRKGAGQLSTDADTITALVVDTLNLSFDANSPQSADFTISEIKEISIEDIHNEIFVAPADAAYDPETGGIFPSVTGISFDIPTTQAAYDKASIGDEISVDLIFTEPEIIAQNADELLYRDVLHTVSTYLTSSYNRTNNIRLAAATINGYILQPGETFSFNDAVGKRTTEKGYKEAGAYVGGKTVPDVGGGICQVSSSLYCCAVYTDLEIVERYNHMFPVSYLPLGIDATVNWGTLDFKFKNTMDFPIKIEAYIDEEAYDLVVTFHGTKLDESYAKCTYEIISVYGYETVEELDPTLPAGARELDTSGMVGYLVYTYRSWYDADGELIETEFLDTSDYDSRDEVYLIGPEPEPEPEPTPEPTPPPAETEPPSEGSGETAVG